MLAISKSIFKETPRAKNWYITQAWVHSGLWTSLDFQVKKKDKNVTNPQRNKTKNPKVAKHEFSQSQLYLVNPH